MAKVKHLRILNTGVQEWNKWRVNNPSIRPDLRGANLESKELIEVDLHKADLRGTNLMGANLSKANLSGAILREANLSRALLTDANFNSAYLNKVDFSFSILVRVNMGNTSLIDANLRAAELGNANLSGANMSYSNLVEAKIDGANLNGCKIYGISAWSIKKDKNTKQDNLIISTEPLITVDNLEIAQFIYLLINNKNLRNVIDTLTSKTVLILGRFTEEREEILHAICDELRLRNYVPILFNFEKPLNRDTKETVLTLASMSKFIIVDITEPRSVPLELATVAPNLPNLPIQPIMLDGAEPWGMYDGIQSYHSVCDLIKYRNTEELLRNISIIINSVEKKLDEIRN